MGTKEICGVILAGGRNTRMGRDKALLELGGKTIIERQADLLRERLTEVLISTNNPAEYSFMGLPLVKDLNPGRGPLEGLRSAMLSSGRSLFLVLACDMPAVTLSLLDQLIRCSDGFDAVVPRTSDKKPHPLCAIYRRSCLTAIERNLSGGDLRFSMILEDPGLKVGWIDPGERGFLDADLCNLNAPEDILKYMNRGSGKS
jgi:molybdopterin-guanine dinucleotide biosynthesis protein A